MRALAENETWDLVDTLKCVKLIGCRWVYKVKYNVDDSINRYKARLVAKGYAQTHEIGYDETVSTSLDRNQKLCHSSAPACDERWFSKIDRSLIYLTITLLDLSFPNDLIHQFM